MNAGDGRARQGNGASKGVFDETAADLANGGIRDDQVTEDEEIAEAEVLDDATDVEAAEAALEIDLSDAAATIRAERDEYLDMLRRVQADFENYKKRMVRQQTDLLERAAEQLVVKLLPVFDAFGAARDHYGDSPEGKALIQALLLFEDTLAKEGLERIDSVEVEFDPVQHEAVEHEETDETGGHMVTGVLRPGFRYKNKVIRPAMVKVRG